MTSSDPRGQTTLNLISKHSIFKVEELCNTNRQSEFNIIDLESFVLERFSDIYIMHIVFFKQQYTLCITNIINVIVSFNIVTNFIKFYKTFEINQIQNAKK